MNLMNHQKGNIKSFEDLVLEAVSTHTKPAL